MIKNIPIIIINIVIKIIKIIIKLMTGNHELSFDPTLRGLEQELSLSMGRCGHTGFKRSMRRRIMNDGLGCMYTQTSQMRNGHCSERLMALMITRCKNQNSCFRLKTARYTGILISTDREKAEEFFLCIYFTFTFWNKCMGKRNLPAFFLTFVTGMLVFLAVLRRKQEFRFLQKV